MLCAPETAEIFRNTGVLEYWSVGASGGPPNSDLNAMHYSITPAIQYSKVFKTPICPPCPRSILRGVTQWLMNGNRLKRNRENG